MATVLRVPLADGVAWFKACAPVQAFEPRLTARALRALARSRRPRCSARRGAGLAVARRRGHADRRVVGNPPEAWLAVLPRYAELQRGEAGRDEHLAHGVPDLRVATLPARYEDLLQHDLPLEATRSTACALRPAFAELCAELVAHGCRRRSSTTTSTWPTSTPMATSCACSTGATRRSRTRSRRSS